MNENRMRHLCEKSSGGSGAQCEKCEQLESSLRMTRKALSMFDGVYRLASQGGDEKTLLQKICQLIVDTGQYRMVWIGYAQNDARKTVLPVGQAGFETGYLAHADITWQDELQGHGPTGTAIRTARTVVNHNSLKNPRFRPWQTEASERGYASTAALPLLIEGQILGALNICSDRQEAFNAEEIGTLESIAGRIAFSIRKVRLEAQHQKILAETEKREALYRSLFMNNHTVMFLIDPDTADIVEANPAACAFYGYSAEAFRRKKITDLNVALTEEEAFLEMEHAAARTCNSFFFKHRLASGEARDVEVYSGPMNLEGRQLLYSIILDMSDRKRAEDGLHRSEERFRIAFQMIPDAFAITTRPAEGHFVEINAGFTRMTGYAWEDVRGKSVFDIGLWGNPADRGRLICALRKGSQVSEFEGSLRLKSGRLIPVLIAAALISLNNTPHILFVAKNIEKLKKAEAALRKNQEQLRKENVRLKSSIKGSYKFGRLIGKSDIMQVVYNKILHAAGSSANVIIYGESGTGKELVARTIHEMSDRAGREFIPVNCGAIPESLFESEFFGHEKGAFTGAIIRKRGFLEVANEGILFLDEVGEIGLNMQVKLLRAIEGGGYSAIGSSRVKKTDIRIIAATNRDLKKWIREGGMREDFYYRLHVIPIYLPPLRDRKDDIPLLMYHFLETMKDKQSTYALTDKVLNDLQAYHWPGNIRELQNVIQRYITLGDIEIADNVPHGFIQPEQGTRPLPADCDLRTAMQFFEKQFIAEALARNSGNRTRTARLLRIDRRTLLRKIQSYALTR
ncbi:sigma-54-dependent Fis family transcriptional re gulator [Desulfonema ishimotonii]|uniref:Sigma-54-dependent Fis family transcriptional re gulator n=1 Tax=Desulfonema ishimotonii TaxID=45657 RepID=A0A401FZF6_9BACT|nr:sigma 54-interacting transcriptional regulator [Desulfonema ishimotonii]GBC62361.1 sigma-54-dependent Fis family transcriptional re gulator [Desulfonema ishimotonii]